MEHYPTLANLGATQRTVPGTVLWRVEVVEQGSSLCVGGVGVWGHASLQSAALSKAGGAQGYCLRLFGD